MTSGGHGRSSKPHQAIDCKMACWTEARPPVRPSVAPWQQSLCTTVLPLCRPFPAWWQLLTCNIYVTPQFVYLVLSAITGFKRVISETGSLLSLPGWIPHEVNDNWQSFLPYKHSLFRIKVFFSFLFVITRHITLVWLLIFYPISVPIFLT